MSHKLQLILSALALVISRVIGSSNVSHSFGAKSGVISAPSGADEVVKATAAAEPAVKTLAETMRDALGAASDDKRAIINLATRKVTIVPVGVSIATLTGATGIASAAVFTMDDPTKATGTMTGEVTGNGDAGEEELLANVANTETKPSLSVPSLVNKLEDVISDPAGDLALAGKSAFIVVDQDSADVTVYLGTVAHVEAVNGASVAEDAEFVQTLSVSGGRQFGE